MSRRVRRVSSDRDGDTTASPSSASLRHAMTGHIGERLPPLRALLQGHSDVEWGQARTQRTTFHDQRIDRPLDILDRRSPSRGSHDTDFQSHQRRVQMSLSSTPAVLQRPHYSGRQHETSPFAHTPEAAPRLSPDYKRKGWPLDRWHYPAGTSASHAAVHSPSMRDDMYLARHSRNGVAASDRNESERGPARYPETHTTQRRNSSSIGSAVSYEDDAYRHKMTAQRHVPDAEGTSRPWEGGQIYTQYRSEHAPLPSVMSASPGTPYRSMHSSHDPYTSDAGDTERRDSPPRKAQKTHVQSACLNCKKAHLACDVRRPCQRCINLGKTDTCIDVQHKKRGRPRLQYRDASPHRTTPSSQSQELRPSSSSQSVSRDERYVATGMPVPYDSLFEQTTQQSSRSPADDTRRGKASPSSSSSSSRGDAPTEPDREISQALPFAAQLLQQSRLQMRQSASTVSQASDLGQVAATVTQHQQAAGTEEKGLEGASTTVPAS